MVVTLSMNDKTRLLAAIRTAPLHANSTAFMTDPAPLLSFLEDAGDEGVPQYDEGPHDVPTPPSTGPPSTSSGTRPPSLLSRTPSDQSRAFSRHFYAMASSDAANRYPTPPRKAAEVDAWRREQQAAHLDETATVVSPARHLSEQLSSLLRIEAQEEQQSTPTRLEDMTDAEIAQHHFRLAQQHLRAAQRLALAAASAPPAHSSTASSAPSSYASSAVSKLAQPRAEPTITEQQQRDYEPTVAPVPAKGLPPQPAAFAGERRAPQRSGDSYFPSSTPEACSPSSSTGPSATTTLSYASTTATTPPSSSMSAPEPSLARVTRPAMMPRIESSTSAVSVQSAPLVGVEGPSRPVPPPRRATVESSISKAGLGAEGPSLYGAGLPAATAAVSKEDHHRVTDPVPGLVDDPSATEPAPTRNSDDWTSAPRAGPTHSGKSHTHPLLDLTPEEEEEVAADESDGNPDWDDARSDFYGAESVISHVTRATLPGYEDALAASSQLPDPSSSLSSPPPPPVPTIPTRFLGPVSSLPSAPVPQAVENAPRLAPLRTAVEEADAQGLHGFRPRQTHPNFVPASAPWVQPTHLQHHSTAVPFSNLQPHAYVLSPSGQPIPVYSSAAFSPTATGLGPASPPLPFAAASIPAPAQAQAPATRTNTLPIHAQPLRFEHSVPYSAPYTNSTIEVHYANGNISGPAPALTSRPSAGSLSQLYHADPVPRPQSSWSDTSSGADDARSIAAASTLSTRTRTRMASLRAKVPHVRFMSPDPTVLRSGRGGSGSGSRSAGATRQAPKTGVRRSASVIAATAGAPRSSSAQQPPPPPPVIPEQTEGESEAERDKRHRAIQMSLGMLI
ncbi:hypothetical protein JCM3774_000192 [Rhodotorula dairenensis]